MIEWVAGLCTLILLIIVIRRKQGRSTGILVMAVILMAAMLTVTYTNRRKQDVSADAFGEENRNSADAALSGSTLQEDFLLATDSDDPAEGNGQGLELQSPVGSVFGYSDYTGYLDQCVQWMDYAGFVDCDYDGDGITDRVWRENILDLGVADYRIEFGNGDLIELPRSAGGIPVVRFLDLEGDGVREILFTETSGYSTDTETYGQMALFRKSGENYEMVELPEELSRVDSEQQTFDKTMVGYQPSLSVRYEAAGEYLMRVTGPESENVEGSPLLDVVVDFTQEAWEMGDYDKFCSSSLPGFVVPCHVDILPLENGKDALLLYFGMLNEWCDDRTVVTLEWENENLCIRDIRYLHNYIETAYVEIGGQQYELIIRGSGFAGEGRYTIDSIRVDYIHYDERFKGMVEDQVQFIDPGEAAKQYWGEANASEGGIMTKAVSSSRNGNILVVDLNFDGNEDFCIQGWIPEGGNIPYYCYFWNENAGQFEYEACLFNVDADEDSRIIRSTVYEADGGYGVEYYRCREGVPVLERYVKEDTSSDAVLDHLDLTYAEVSYSIDEGNYLQDAPRLFRLAEKALTELYQITGTKVQSACFTVTEYGDFYFASTENELRASRSYYDRRYGAQEGFEDCITCINIADGQEEYGSRTSPVEYHVSPPDQKPMTDEEIVQWYFENSPLAQISRWRLGNATIRTGDRVDMIEETFEGNYVIRTKSGKYFELTYNKDTGRVNSYYGPYESFPEH